MFLNHVILFCSLFESQAFLISYIAFVFMVLCVLDTPLSLFNMLLTIKGFEYLICSSSTSWEVFCLFAKSSFWLFCFIDDWQVVQSTYLKKEKKLCFCVFLDRSMRCGYAVEIHCCGGPLRDLAMWTMEIVRLSLMLFMKEEGKCTNSRSLRRAPAICHCVFSLLAVSLGSRVRRCRNDCACKLQRSFTRLVVVSIFIIGGVVFSLFS